MRYQMYKFAGGKLPQQAVANVLSYIPSSQEVLVMKHSLRECRREFAEVQYNVAARIQAVASRLMTQRVNGTPMLTDLVREADLLLAHYHGKFEDDTGETSTTQ